MIAPTQHSQVPVWQAALHDPVAFATVLLVVVTAGLWISTFLLWRATVQLAREAKESADAQGERMERSVDAANKAASAATEQVKIAEEIAKRELRAYVCLRPIKMNEIVTGDAPITIVVPFENTGVTPANRLLIQWAWQVTSDGPTSDFYKRTLDRYPPKGDEEYSIGPRQLKEMPIVVKMGSEYRNKILSGDMSFLFLGRIHYLDAFEDKHVTEFFYRYTKELPNRLGQVNIHNNIF